MAIEYTIIDVVLTATDKIYQEIDYDSLVADDGTILASEYSSAPKVNILGVNKDVNVYLYEAEGVSSFKLIRSPIHGDISGTILVNLLIILPAGATAVAVEPVTSTEIKTFCKIDIEDDNQLLYDLILTAREYAERMTSRSFITKTLTDYLNQFPSGTSIKLKYSKGQAITSIIYYDTDDTTYTMDSDDYSLDNEIYPSRITLNYGCSWPSTTLRTVKSIVITYTAGYGTAAIDVPEPIRSWIRQCVAFLYENRTHNIDEFPYGLLNQYTIWDFKNE